MCTIKANCIVLLRWGREDVSLGELLLLVVCNLVDDAKKWQNALFTSYPLSPATNRRNYPSPLQLYHLENGPCSHLGCIAELLGGQRWGWPSLMLWTKESCAITHWACGVMGLDKLPPLHPINHWDGWRSWLCVIRVGGLFQHLIFLLHPPFVS